MRDARAILGRWRATCALLGGVALTTAATALRAHQDVKWQEGE